ncbi:MAG: GcrA family cell cycle regulator [Rickettsiales bacterium]|jgi:GcrA cell cycle regulator|nr:GcrA family cell cycle regulator [Rickettsiales bacterium]
MSVGTWNKITLQKLKTLVDRGLSTSEIGKKLGMTKNAIVGKLNRLGWNAKSIAAVPPAKSAARPVKKTPVPAKKTAAAAPASKKKPAQTPIKPAPAKSAKPAATAKSVKSEPARATAKAAAPTPAPRTNPKAQKNSVRHTLAIANLKSDQCRWPIGNPDGDDFHFCGAKIFPGKPYCYDHCLQAYQFMPKKK